MKIGTAKAIARQWIAEEAQKMPLLLCSAENLINGKYGVTEGVFLPSQVEITHWYLQGAFGHFQIVEVDI